MFKEIIILPLNKGGVSVKQLSLMDKPTLHYTTCEWYQKEKEKYALSSPYRPKFENTLQYNFRQTSFPKMFDECESFGAK